MAARRLSCVSVPGQAGVLAVITTGSTVCGFGTLTAESVRDCRASVYAAACPPSSAAISVNRAAAAVHPSVVACVANPGYIVVCSQVSPVMESCRLAALVPTNPASTASPAKCSRNSTWAVPLNSLASAVWWVPAAPSVGVAVIASARVAVAKTAIPFIRKRSNNIPFLLSHARRSSAASRISRCRSDGLGTYGDRFSPCPLSSCLAQRVDATCRRALDVSFLSHGWLSGRGCGPANTGRAPECATPARRSHEGSSCPRAPRRGHTAASVLIGLDPRVAIAGDVTARRRAGGQQSTDDHFDV